MERPVEHCRKGRTAEVNTILDTTPQAGSPVMFLVTSFQFLPASLVYHAFPSLVPAQMRPFWTSEAAMEKTTSP